MYRWISGVMLGAIALAVVLGGCGGGSDTSSSLTKAEYVKQANAICAERKDRWDAALASYRKEAKEKQAETKPKIEKELIEKTLGDSMLPALEQQLKALENLGGPDGKEKQAAKMVDTLAKELRSIEKPAALLGAAFTDFEEQAKALGVNCTLF